MKAVLISIRPEWCEKILNGEKIIEVRKTQPRLATPFKCYIYETKHKTLKYVWGKEDYRGYFPDEVFDAMPDDEKNFCKIPDDLEKGGKVIAEFTCSGVEKALYNKNGYGLKDEKSILKKSCLIEKELYHYLQGRDCYLWHISDLKVYDRPKEVSDFMADRLTTTDCYQLEALKRPPQSWCYVEELEDGT